VWPGGLCGLAATAGYGISGLASPSLAVRLSGGIATLLLPALIAALPPVLVAIRLLHTARRPARPGHSGIAPG
jgi:hypothetical protein